MMNVDSFTMRKTRLSIAQWMENAEDQSTMSMTMLDNRFSRGRNVEIMVLTKMKMRKKQEDDDFSRLSLANIDDVEE